MRTRKMNPGRYALIALGLATFACGDDESEPTLPSLNIDAGADAGTGPGIDASTDAGTDAGAGGSCTGAGGCYACKPASSAELLNACTTGTTCSPFDNATRIQGYQPGQPLPPL